MKTANEEILSSNEELLSTNEELETAKEELQSTNEELITTNEELQDRNKEVVLLNSDLINLLTSINMPVIMMGTDLCVRRVTPQAEKVLNVVSSDVGRPISKIKLSVDIPDFEKILLDVIENLHQKTFEIKDKEENWYSVYIRPYRTLDNKINGVVAIFIDITEHKKAQQVIEDARTYSESILETMREPLIMLNADLKVISANKSFRQAFKVDHKESEDRFIYDLGNGQWNIPRLRELLENILPMNNAIDNYEIEHDFENIGPKTMLFNARRFMDTKMILITIEDITERKQAEETIHRERDRAQMYLDTVETIIVALNTEGKITTINRKGCQLFGRSEDELVGQSWFSTCLPQPDGKEKVYPVFLQHMAGKLEATEYFENPIITRSGELRQIAWHNTLLHDEQGRITGTLSAGEDITERKQAEKKIEWLSSFPVLNPLPVLEIGRKGEIYFINSAARRAFPDIEKKKFAHPFLAGIKSHFDKPHKKEIEYFYREVEIDGCWYSQVITVVDLNRIRLYSFDITERKRMEKKMAQAKEDEFRAIFDNAVDGILIVDTENKKFYRGNNAICRMLGYSPQEIKGLGVEDIHPKRDLPYVISQFERQAKGEIQLAESLPVKRKDGSVFYADINSTTIVIAGKAYLIGFFRDITKRKQAEDLLRQSEDRYRSLFESSRDAIMTLEPPSWKFTSGNMATIEMFRVKNEEEFLTYQPWELSPLYQPDGRKSQDKSKEMIEIAMNKGAHFFEWTHKRATGEEFLTNVLLSRVKLGGKVFLHATVRDITEQRRLEEELRIADEQRATVEMRSRFTSMVSHELRSPLGAIKEGINLVLEGLAGNINDEQKDLLSTAKRNTDRLGRLINNVLDYQKIESGKLEFETLKNNLNETVKEVYKSMSFLAKEKGLQLLIDTDDSIPAIIFDKDRIIQVITNLVSNAIKYTEKGSVTIRTKQKDDAVCVSVQDTGIGVKAEDIEKLFCAFEQLDGPRDKKKGGTGLGLAISKEIILAHQGNIWAESEIGKGSTFHFTIPGKFKEKKKLGEILIEEGKITENDLKKALNKQRQ
ncbi:MAG: PAS domain S-box protein [Phycisphaerae bacterium]